MYQDDKKYYLKELRIRKKLSQREVAKILGVTYQTYNRWEQDLTGVAIGKVKKIAEFYNVRVDQIMLKY